MICLPVIIYGNKWPFCIMLLILLVCFKDHLSGFQKMYTFSGVKIMVKKAGKENKGCFHFKACILP